MWRHFDDRLSTLGGSAASGDAVPVVGTGTRAGVARDPLPEILWRRRGIALAVFGTCAAVAVAYLLLATPKYLSTARLHVRQTGPRLYPAAPAQGDASAGRDGFLDAQAELVRSVPVLADALARPGVGRLGVFDGIDDKLAHLGGTLEVGVGRRDEVITVAYAAADPGEAAALVNAVVESYVRFNAVPPPSTASAARGVLQAEKHRQEIELARRDEQLLELTRSTSALFESEKGTTAAHDLAAASQQLTAARARAGAARAVYQASKRNPDALADLVDAEDREVELQQVVDGLRARLAEILEVRAEQIRLQVERQRTERLVEQLDGRIHELDVPVDAPPLNVKVLEPARPAKAPAYPRRALTVALAVAVGLALASTAAVAADRLDDRVRTPDEASELLDLPVLAVVPAADGPWGRSATGRDVLAVPGSATDEAYRGLRTALCASAHGDRLRTILVTSAGPGDGKSTAAANLAVALAGSGRRVLLVDADLRDPVLHAVFPGKPGPGLSDVLARGLGALPGAVRSTGVPGLSLLPCGAVPPDPAALLNGETLSALLDAAADAYDAVVIDSPAGTVGPDARIVAAQCDATLVVVRARSSTRRGSVRACRGLLDVGARLTGVVMTAVPDADGTARYGGHRSRRDSAADPAARGLLTDASVPLVHPTAGGACVIAAAGVGRSVVSHQPGRRRPHSRLTPP